MYIYIYIYVHIYMYAHIYIYIYIYSQDILDTQTIYSIIALTTYYNKFFMQCSRALCVCV